MRIDLNSDMGESFGAWTMGDDAAMLAIVSSANVACGWHGGDHNVMYRTAELARANGVAIGPESPLDPPMAADMEGKLVLITGGTAGIGKQAAIQLLRLGAQVVLVGRNPEKTTAVVAELNLWDAEAGNYVRVQYVRPPRVPFSSTVSNEPGSTWVTPR